MTHKEIAKLRNINAEPLGGYTAFTATSYIPDAEMTFSHQFFPTIIFGDSVYDYTVTAENFLKRDNITEKDTSNTFLEDAYPTTKVYDLKSLSIKKVQEIINRNNYLFSQIREKMLENALINQINEA